jgi:hypothetical protein
MMKGFLLFFLFGCLLFAFAQSVGAQQVSQKFDVSWSYSGNTQTGFRVERMPPGGTFGVVATVAPDVRSYTDMVMGSPGDQFSWRIIAFNTDQTSPYSNIATKSIDVISTVSPPAPSVMRIVRNKNQCTFTLTGAPPDELGGWTVQFRSSVAPFGSPDSTLPYSVAANLKAGSYDFSGTWTKPGQPTLQSGHAAGQCP